jgi:ribosome-binding protein aMBF1 (putative translation factor)
VVGYDHSPLTATFRDGLGDYVKGTPQFYRGADLLSEQTRKTRQKKIDRLVAQWDQSVRHAIQGSRRDKGLNQETAAERMGWSLDILSNVEAGRRDITVAEFIVLAQQMDVDPVVMFRRVMNW